MQQLVLIINTGSSSVKFSVFEAGKVGEPKCLREGEIKAIGTDASIKIKAFPDAKVITNAKIIAPSHAAAVDAIEKWARSEFTAATWVGVGHRIVHGGQKFIDPVLISSETLAELHELIPFDPLHQPIGIAGIESCQRLFNGVPQIACFDTAFHATQPEVAKIIALPQQFADQGIRRYGFHGLSYQYISSMLGDLDSTLASGRVVIAHLGSGASLCAVKEGKSIATTMGFSVLDGLAMGTRCGSIDPGAILYLLNSLKIAPIELENILYNKSGLLGISGISSDVRTLLASTESSAKNALDYYVYRIAREMASLIPTLGGIDGMVFTGGVGEHSSEVRHRVIAQLSWLGFQIHKSCNDEHVIKISAPDSKLPIYVLRTNENQMIARHVLARLLSL